MYTIAYHGDGATPNKLANDIGPNIKIDHYWHNLDKEQALNWLIDHANLGPFNLIGYSRGGHIITHITQYHPELINSAILYETPILEYKHAPGTYPILIIWNNKGRQNTQRHQNTRNLEQNPPHNNTTKQKTPHPPKPHPTIPNPHMGPNPKPTNQQLAQHNK